jgi:hypothetical protein
VPHYPTTSVAPQPAIFPGWNGSVICNAEDGELELATMSWGFVLLQDGKAPRREDYIHAQLEVRADTSVKIGRAQAGTSASLVTWSIKSEGTHFSDVSGDNVKHIC